MEHQLPLLSTEQSFRFLCELISSHTSFVYSKSSRSFYKAIFKSVESLNIHVNTLKHSNSFKCYPHLNHKRFHDTLIYIMIIIFNSCFKKNIYTFKSTYSKITLVISKMLTQSQYTPSLFVSLLKCILLLSTVKVLQSGRISQKNFNIKHFYLYELAFDTLVNGYVTYNKNTSLTAEQVQSLCEFIDYFNNTFIRMNCTNVYTILNHVNPRSSNNNSLLVLMAHLLTKTDTTSYNAVSSSIMSLLINIYKHKFNYISCMKPCIELAMTAYTNMTSENTFTQMQERLHLINFPIAFISSLFSYEEHNSINNDYTLINNAFHFNCKHCGVFLSEYFDFSYAYYVFSVCLFPKEGIDTYTVLHFDKKDEGDTIDVKLIKHDNKLYRVVIQLRYKKKPRNDVIIDTGVRIRAYVSSVLIIHFDKDRVDTFYQCGKAKVNVCAFEKSTVNTKAFTKSKMKLLIGCERIIDDEFRHSTTVNVNVFRGLIGPVICVKELNEEQIHHLFALGGNYERVLFDERYDFSNEMKYCPDDAALEQAYDFYSRNPVQTDNIVIFVSPLSFQFIPYEDCYYINNNNKNINTNISNNKNGSIILKKCNYAHLRNTKNLSFKSKVGICCKCFSQKFLYITNNFSKYEVLRCDGINFLTLIIEFHFQLMLHYEHDIINYKLTLYNQIVTNLNNIFKCIQLLISHTKLFHFITPLRKMCFTLNKLFTKYCEMQGTLNDILPGLSTVIMFLAGGFVGNTAYNTDSLHNIKTKVELYKCFCQMLLKTPLHCLDVHVLVCRLLPLTLNLNKYRNIITPSIIDNALSFSDAVLFDTNTNESYIKKYIDMLCELLTPMNNDNDDTQHAVLVNYFYTNYIDSMRGVVKEQTYKDVVKHYLKMYNMLLIMYRCGLCKELNETNVNGFVELYDEIKIKVDFERYDNSNIDNEVIVVVNKILKLIVIMFLQYSTGINKVNALKRNVHKLKELPCCLDIIETIVSSMIVNASEYDMFEFNKQMQFELEFESEQQQQQQCMEMLTKFGIITAVMCRRKEEACKVEYKEIYDLMRKCVFKVVNAKKEHEMLFKEFFSYKQHICVALFLGSLFNIYVNVNTNVNKEFINVVKEDFLCLVKLLFNTHDEPFTLHLLKSIVARSSVVDNNNTNTMNNDILIDVVIDVLKIINNSCNDNNTGGNTNCIVNTIETIKLLQLCYINIDNIFFNNNNFVLQFISMCHTIRYMNILHVKILYDNYIDVSKKATLSEIIFNMLTTQYLSTHCEIYLTTLIDLFIINISPTSHKFTYNNISLYNDNNTNNTCNVTSYRSLFYDIDVLTEQHKVNATTQMENIDNYLLTQFYLGKVVLALYCGNKNGMEAHLYGFYNVLGKILFNDYTWLISDGKFMKTFKKRKSENAMYEQVSAVYNKLPIKTFTTFKQILFEHVDKHMINEGYTVLTTYSLVKKTEALTGETFVDTMNNNNNTSRKSSRRQSMASGSYGDNKSGGNNNNNNNNKQKRKSFSSVNDDIHKATFSQWEHIITTNIEEEHNSLTLEIDSLSNNNNNNDVNCGEAAMNVNTEQQQQQQQQLQHEQCAKAQEQVGFFAKWFTFSKPQSQPILQSSITNNKTNVTSINKGDDVITITDFAEVSINNCILSPKKELLMSNFGNVFKDVFLYNSEFVRLKRFFIRNVIHENTNTKQLNYPSKLRNYSNTIDPPIFLKHDKHFYINNPYFSLSYIYYDNKWTPSNINHITIMKQRIHPSSTIITTYPCELITTEKNIYGHIILTNNFLLFEHLHDDPRTSTNISLQLSYIFSSLENDIIIKDKQICIFYTTIKELLTRRFLFMWQGIEMYLRDGRSYFFNFFSEAEQLRFAQALQLTVRSCAPSTEIKTVLSVEAIAKEVKHAQSMWSKGTISVYDYLLLMNKYGSRTFKDISQYPVFPWISTNVSFIMNLFNLVEDVKDKISKPNHLEFTLHERYCTFEFDDNTTRKVTQIKEAKVNVNYNNTKYIRLFLYPISVQTEDKRKLAMERYNDNIQEDRFPFHLGNHYSTSSFVYFYLMRISPFNNGMISLQGGCLENPNRMFHSLKDTVHILKNSSDNRELIPQMFTCIEHFINLNCVYYGKRTPESIGVLVDDVVFGKDKRTLDTYVKFLYQHKKLLNSPLIANELHSWLNYVFGVNQITFEQSTCSNFQKSTYAQKEKLQEKKTKYVNALPAEQAKHKLKSKVNMIINFGQTPHKLFNVPHPKYKNELVSVSDDPSLIDVMISNAMQQTEYVDGDGSFVKDNNNNNNVMQFQYMNVEMNSNIVYYVYDDVVRVKHFFPDKQPKTMAYTTIAPFQRGSLFQKDVHELYDFISAVRSNNNNNNIQQRHYKSSLISPEYCYVLMCNCNCFVSCRYLDHTFKLYKVLPDNNKDNTKPLAVHVSCFVNCICKINEHRLLTGLHNGKIIEWDITIDDNNPKAKPHCVHIREIFAHSTGVNAIEYYTRFDLVITAGDDSCICIRKYFDFEMMNYITMNTKYKVMSIKISSLNLIYVLCYNANTKRNVIFAYTVNAIKFAESIEGVYSNMQFTKNGNVIVGNCENGNVMILTAYALNVLAIIRLKNKIYQKCGDIAWVKYEIEENMLLVGIKRGIVFYYKILVDEPERSMYD